MYALEKYGGRIYAGTAGSRVFVSNGTNSTLAYDGGDDQLGSLAVYGGKLYVGTKDNSGVIYAYNGSDGKLLFDPPGTLVPSLEIYNGKLYAGTGTNGLLYAFNGSNWTLIHNSSVGGTPTIFAMNVFNGKLYFGVNYTIYTLGSNPVLSSNRTTWDTGWHHLAATFNGSMMKIYVDGVLDSEKNLGGEMNISDLTADLRIGDDYSNGYLKAGLDEVRVWTKARTQQEINASKDRLLISSEDIDGLAAYYRFDEGYGSKVVDHSRNGNMLTLGTSNATSFAPSWTADARSIVKQHNSLYLDGIDDALVIPNSASLESPQRELTISTWVYINQSFAPWTNDYDMGIVDKG
ncbi:hypothetical protein COV22_04545, partial [Candidatus Woesearchaeota archaeon CG10_big_fil_rev_8_21_14_0_10_47_5]